MKRMVTVWDSPLGKIQLCSDGVFLTALTFVGQNREENHIPADAVLDTCPAMEQAQMWLSQYFDGKIPNFLPPMKPMGTPFQEKVWDLLLQIPYGETVTYGELAKRLGCRSAQAVGGAVGKNPICILIPCHRVMGVNGKLTGYAGGVKKKEYLLALEKRYG